MLKYQIALTNAIFDDTYRNVLRFDTRAEQEAYFKVNTLFANAVNCNFNVGSLYATKVVVDYKDQNVDLNELMNNNYCIVKDNTEGATLKYYYYFVKNAQQECGNRLLCDLELDVYQTYYLDVDFDDCTILRAHLNRFIDNGNGTVSFDATPSSKLFEREDVQNLPKRLVSRHRFNCGNDFVDNNIICWMYIYLDPNHDFNFYTPNGSSRTIKPSRVINAGLQTNIGCLVVPVVKQTIDVTLKTLTGDYNLSIGHIENSIGGQFLRGFEELNQGYNYVYSIKYSLMPPSAKFNELLHNMVNNTPNIAANTFVDCKIEGLGRGSIVAVKDLDKYIGGILLRIPYSETGYLKNVNIGNYNINRRLTFTKEEIINANVKFEYNPKLNNNDYYELNICDNAGNNFTYDLQKFNTQNLQLLMSEPQTPDFTKNYTRLIPPANNTLYIQETTQNLLGLVTSNDNTVLMPTSAYQTMIANNKNFFAQNSYNRAVNLLQAGVKGIDNPTEAANVGIDYMRSVQNQKFEIDNLRNAPSSIQAANGNFIFNSLCSDPGIYIEEYDITENAKKAVNDYMMRYGFNYNRIDNIKNVDNIRKNYNYVQAYVEEIKTGLVNISNLVHNKLREIFARGLRMWNARTFDYAKENYERWLEQ